MPNDTTPAAAADNVTPSVTPEPAPTSVSLDTADLTTVRMVLGAMISALQAGPRSRARSLVITKLEEASMWAGEGLRLEQVPYAVLNAEHGTS